MAISEARLLAFRDWTGGRSLPNLGTNVGADVLPFQSWRRFKEAFAPELVEQALRETPGSVHHIVDPFGGSGTTALAAQFLGIRATIIEVNPYLADLIEAKIATVDLDRAATELRAVVEQVSLDENDRDPVFPGAPVTFIEPGENGRWIFSRVIAKQILAYRSAIETVADPGIRRLFRVALASIVVPVSNITISGKGRRYRRGWNRRIFSAEVVDRLFCEQVTNAFYELRRYGARRCRTYTILRGDARKLVHSVGHHDLAVFSPPYPNSFDYTDVYNVELWAAGYLKGKPDNLLLRNATIRSHVQIYRDFAYPNLPSNTLHRTITALREVKSHLWNKHIPEMVGAYMADMSTVLGGLSKSLRTGGRIYMIVGDSRYATVNVPVSQILYEIAPSLGYIIRQMEPFRSMRASPQQGGRHELSETLLVLENP